MQRDILGPITHMFVTSDLFTLVHCLNVQAAQLPAIKNALLKCLFLAFLQRLDSAFTLAAHPFSNAFSQISLN